MLLEGDPGAGKSVALRHVARELASRAMKARDAQAVLPLYVNLRELRRGPDDSIDVQQIRLFVVASMNRGNDVAIARFLEEEFDRGLAEGTWLFLFDSFDEIPEILSATQVDEVIQAYVDAIYDFMHGMNQARGIVASRSFRGPRSLGWPRFRVLNLSLKKQRAMVRRALLPPNDEGLLLSRLDTADLSIRQLAVNPLFLGLLCEHVRDAHDFPTGTHAVFETYLTHRFERDRAHLAAQFGISADELRPVAEQVAYCILATPGLGLAPPGAELERAMVSLNLISGRRLAAGLDALEGLRLARGEVLPDGAGASFQFAHRRFQEYFATCLLMERPELIGVEDLLTDGRWRETCVTMLQNRSPEQYAPLIAAAGELVQTYAAAITAAPVDEIALGTATGFEWPADCLHVLGILVGGQGFGGARLPPSPEGDVDVIVRAAWERGA